MNGASTIAKTTKNAEKCFVKKGTTSKLSNVDKLSQTPKGGGGKFESITQKIQGYVGRDPFLQTTQKGSDLIIRSKDRCRQIRFDLTNPHGLEPHINVETFKPRNLFPGDRKMIQTENYHVFPKK